ncbi:hypothetical protein Mp_1g00860 [Marchantia polymorpha subsp. ruderalis]|uniref:HAT C-terminal dimerisation domain-containing protein n=2 Tax=Marchantia polymorpha TaxID=3197 RepID=A0AAF6AK37_MARPO|nr:hypothetical protein MARPO_0103s0003 [Marchantia polymorpha]BBM96807.1 hypothetical protein Mp_1g00860 [Marchantia polymorpha subsp. ruderalis]|eukprot:PTQ32021.1 hypothetical protein MARPO_0103s0003 [Marchantia polymorpha]
MTDVNIANEIFSSVDKFDGDNEEKINTCAKLIMVETLSTSKRKRSKRNFPWIYVHEWQFEDPSKEKMKRKSNEVSCSQLSLKYLIKSTIDKPAFSEQMLTKYENVVVDYIIGGVVSLRASRSVRFKKMVFTLTNGYEPPSTQTILRQITKLYRILLPTLGLFITKLDVAFCLFIDGWSNRNLKDFYVVTAHCVDIKTLSRKSILLTILDVECSTGGMGTGVLTRLLNVVSDNGSDAIATVTRLFQLINASVGFEQMSNINHVRCDHHSIQLDVIKAMVLTLSLQLDMSNINHVCCDHHSIQLDVIKVLSFTKALRDALVKIRRNKMMRQQYRLEAAVAGFSSKEPTHQDSPTQWNSTHHMGVDAFEKRAVVNSIMEQFAIDICPLQKKTELQLLAINPRITITGMREKIEEYEKLLVLEPAIVAAYLNPLIAKPCDPVELKKLTDLIRSTLHQIASKMLDEVDQFLSIGVVHCKDFIDILSWWSARMEILPEHYKMAMDYFGTPATSTTTERVNNVAGHEFTSSRQSLSSLMFIMTMCLRSWMYAKILKVTANRTIAVAIGSTDKDNPTDEIEDVVNQLEIEQDDWPRLGAAARISLPPSLSFLPIFHCGPHVASLSTEYDELHGDAAHGNHCSAPRHDVVGMNRVEQSGPHVVDLEHPTVAKQTRTNHSRSIRIHHVPRIQTKPKPSTTSPPHTSNDRSLVAAENSGRLRSELPTRTFVVIMRLYLEPVGIHRYTEQLLPPIRSQ